MTTPLFSIITVTWNAGKVIAPTLESVLAQSNTDYEYLLIDGASSDDTVDQVKAAQIPNTRIYSERDKGLYDAMNKGIIRAKGVYLIFLNAGDAFASPNVLDRIAEQAKTNPDIIYGQTQLVNEDRKVVGNRHLTAPEKLSLNSFKQGMLVCHQAFVARRSIVGYYDLSYRFSADYEWCLRCLITSQKNAYLGGEPIISFLTDGMTDKNQRASLKERYKIMCKYFGTAPTILRHISFLPRFAWRKVIRTLKRIF